MQKEKQQKNKQTKKKQNKNEKQKRERERGVPENKSSNKEMKNEEDIERIQVHATYSDLQMSQVEKVRQEVQQRNSETRS